LSGWHRPDGSVLPAPPLRHTTEFPAKNASLPRICVASLVRGISPVCLESLILFHHDAGFECIKLFFDAPDDPKEFDAIAMAKRFERPQVLGPGCLLCYVHVVLCTKRWWTEARERSRFYSRKGELYDEVRELDSKVHDVQARQCVAIDWALSEAQAEGFEWLLHVDGDEVLFCPDQSRHGDARCFFAEVPEHFTAVRFANLEGVAESFEVDNWFNEITLFKLNASLLRDDIVSKLRRSKLTRGFQDFNANGGPEEDLFDISHISSMPGVVSHGLSKKPKAERAAVHRILEMLDSVASVRKATVDLVGIKLPSMPQQERQSGDWFFSPDAGSDDEVSSDGSVTPRVP